MNNIFVDSSFWVIFSAMSLTNLKLPWLFCSGNYVPFERYLNNDTPLK